MKNLKNTLAAAGLTVIMAGSALAGDGILVSDRTGNSNNPCAIQTTGIINQVAGFVMNGFTGIILTDRDGMLLSDRDGMLLSDKGCTAKDGIMISDRDGIMISD